MTTVSADGGVEGGGGWKLYSGRGGEGIVLSCAVV